MTHQVSGPHWTAQHVLQAGPEAELLEPEKVRGGQILFSHRELVCPKGRNRSSNASVSWMAN